MSTQYVSEAFFSSPVRAPLLARSRRIHSEAAVGVVDSHGPVRSLHGETAGTSVVVVGVVGTGVVVRGLTSTGRKIFCE